MSVTMSPTLQVHCPRHSRCLSEQQTRSHHHRSKPCHTPGSDCYNWSSRLPYRLVVVDPRSSSPILSMLPLLPCSKQHTDIGSNQQFGMCMILGQPADLLRKSIRCQSSFSV